MKNTVLKSIILLAISSLLTISMSSAKQAKKPKKIITTKIFVNGCCEECKERIENAVDIKGVRYANWDKEKHELTITYNTKRISIEEIQTLIAKAGHDTEFMKADDKVYNELSGCCHYREGSCQH